MQDYLEDLCPKAFAQLQARIESLVLFGFTADQAIATAVSEFLDN